jgi:hypothetical protein
MSGLRHTALFTHTGGPVFGDSVHMLRSTTIPTDDLDLTAPSGLFALPMRIAHTASAPREPVMSAQGSL